MEMKKTTKMLLAVFILTVASYIGLPYFSGKIAMVSEAEAALRATITNPALPRGLVRPTYPAKSILGWLKQVKSRTAKDSRGRDSVVEDEIIYQPRVNIHELARDIMKSQLSLVSLEGATPANLATAFYSMANAMVVEGDRIDQGPAPIIR